MTGVTRRLGQRTQRWLPTKNRRVFWILFLMIAGYASFLTADVFSAMHTATYDNVWSKGVKYACIVMAFLVTLLIGEDGRDRRDRTLLQIALGLTCVADALISFANQFAWAIGVFLLVQIVYIVRHGRGFVWNRKEVIAALCVYLPVGTLLFVIAPMLSKADLLGKAIAYTFILSTSVWFAIGTIWRGYYRGTMPWLIAIGIVLFFLCDLNVGLHSALKEFGQHTFVDYLELKSGAALSAEQLAVRHELLTEISATVPRWILNAVGIMVWYFYLPAQLLLVMSGYRIEFLRSILPVIPDLRRAAPARA